MNTELIKQTIEDMKEQYLYDNSPWAIAYSGGKDSTVVVNLILNLMINLKKEGITLKPLHIISSDTMVEMPMIENLLISKHKDINKYAFDNDLPITTHIIMPNIKNTFWTLMLGKGYPPPTRDFRWCTSRLKIDSTTETLDNLSKENNLVLSLGVRKEESNDRKESIEKRKTNNRSLSVHDTIPNVFTYSPIKDWSVIDVWSYLTEDNNVWTNHLNMMDLYDKGSGEADCNIALHPENSSCGKTRFGCWTCTVVDKDKSMEGVIKSGEEFLIPLSKYRNYIKEIRNDKSKRHSARRNGVIGVGPFKLEVRKELLKMLFETSKETNIKLIKEEEIIQVQEFWKGDGDFSNYAIIEAMKYDIFDKEKLSKINVDSIEVKNKKIHGLFNEIYKMEQGAIKNGRYGLVPNIVKTVKKAQEAEFLESF